MTKKLALCFDGTWNTVRDHTNVSRIYDVIRAVPDTGSIDAQLKYYDEGVGTRWYDRIVGGSTGLGISENICQAYAWLIERYRDGDQLYLFGFSRGAFTARSLSGLIGRCGIPLCPDIADKHERRRVIGGLAMEAYNLYRASHKPDDASQEFLKKKSLSVRVKFLGVWDTVGALGVPLVQLNVIERFHDTALGKHVDNAFHALAIDEGRPDFEATLWTANPGNAKLEQRWFPGSHANVGGGYRGDMLPRAPLAWIAGHARLCGLQLDEAVLRLDGNEFRAPVRDSYREFLSGLYRKIKDARYHRPIGRKLGEMVDDYAYRKWDADTKYRPKNLPKRDVESAIASPVPVVAAAD